MWICVCVGETEKGTKLARANTLWAPSQTYNWDDWKCKGKLMEKKHTHKNRCFFHWINNSMDKERSMRLIIYHKLMHFSKTEQFCAKPKSINKHTHTKTRSHSTEAESIYYSNLAIFFLWNKIHIFIENQRKQCSFHSIESKHSIRLSLSQTNLPKYNTH